MQPPAQKFAPVPMALHWIMAAGLVLAVIFGLSTVYIDETETSRAALGVHQSLGFVMFLLAIARLYWRVTHAPPPPPEGFPRSQRILSAVTHGTLYLFLLAMPLSGYVGLAARGREIPIFGLFDLPRVAPRSFDLSANAQTLHFYVSFALYALVILHVGAALYHRFVLKDGILERMMPRRKTA